MMLLLLGVALLVGAPQLVLCQSIFTMDWRKVQTEPSKGMDFYKAGNVNTPINNSAASLFPFDASVVKMRLPPCGARTMHIHMNVDELHYVLSGSFLASCALPNGTIISDTIKAGQSFIAPMNFIHEISNPSCTDYAEFLGFYNHYDSNNNNIGAGAYGMPGGTFKAYVDPVRAGSLANAVGFFAYVPKCLARCNLGAKGGMLAPVDPNAPDVPAVATSAAGPAAAGTAADDTTGDDNYRKHFHRKV